MIIETLIAAAAAYGVADRIACAYEYRYDLEREKYEMTLQRHDAQTEREEARTEKLVGALAAKQAKPESEAFGMHL